MVSGVRVVSIRWDSVSVAGIVSIAAGVERQIGIIKIWGLFWWAAVYGVAQSRTRLT